MHIFIKEVILLCTVKFTVVYLHGSPLAAVHLVDIKKPKTVVWEAVLLAYSYTASCKSSVKVGISSTILSIARQ